jgi:hypothetical protein
VRYTRADQFTVAAVVGCGVDEGTTAEGEGVTARVGLAEDVGVARTATGEPEDDAVDDVGAWEQAVSTTAPTTAATPTLILPRRAGEKMSDRRFIPD